MLQGIAQARPVETGAGIGLAPRRNTLAVEISYGLEDHAVNFDLLLLFTENSIPRLTAKIQYLME